MKTKSSRRRVKCSHPETNSRNRTVCLHYNLTRWLKGVWEALRTFLSLQALTSRYFCIHSRYYNKSFFLQGLHVVVFFLGVNISLNGEGWAGLWHQCCLPSQSVSINMGSKDLKCHAPNELLTLHIRLPAVRLSSANGRQLTEQRPRLSAKVWDQWAGGSWWKWWLSVFVQRNGRWRFACL